MRRMLTGFGLVTVIFILSNPSAKAEVFNVSDPAGLQSALTAAASNGADDTVNVAAGTYNIPARLAFASGEDNALALVGAGAASTFLDGGGTMGVLFLSSTGDISVSGLTIRNGYTTSSGAGLDGSTTAAFTIRDCVFSANHTTLQGGGFDVFSTGNLTVANTTFLNNTAAQSGGGAFAGSAGTVAISDSTFSGNTAASGGGLYISGGTTISIAGSVFSGNTTNTGSHGGGLRLTHNGPGALTISESVFSGNLASGACTSADRGVGLSVLSQGPVVFTRNAVVGNTTPCQAEGAGIYLVRTTPAADTVIVADNVFSGNTSGPGTPIGPVALRAVSGTLNVVNNTFSGNDSGEPTTADIDLLVFQDSASLNVSNNIFFGAAGEDELEIGNDGDLNLTTSPTTFRNNIVDPFAVTFTPGGGVAESGNFEADPLFADMAGGDFHLLDGSPAIDAGLPAAPGTQLYDYDGDDRVLGGAVDIGADEFVPPNPATFYPATNTLEIPEVQLGSKAYQVAMTRLDEAGYVFELAKAKKTAATAVPSATFDTATGVLDIAVVQIQGSARTYHVQMMRRPGGYVFDLTKAAKN